MPGILCNRDAPEISDSIEDPGSKPGEVQEWGILSFKNHHGARAMASAATVGTDIGAVEPKVPSRAVVSRPHPTPPSVQTGEWGAAIFEG